MVNGQVQTAAMEGNDFLRAENSAQPLIDAIEGRRKLNVLDGDNPLLSGSLRISDARLAIKFLSETMLAGGIEGAEDVLAAGVLLKLLSNEMQAVFEAVDGINGDLCGHLGAAAGVSHV